jgi:hypothetical protein
MAAETPASFLDRGHWVFPSPMVTGLPGARKQRT